MSSPFAGGRQLDRESKGLLDAAAGFEAQQGPAAPAPAAADRPADPSLAIEFRAVTVRGDTTLPLERTSLAVRAGSLTAIVGATGLTKGAVVELMLARRLPEEGEVLVLGESIAALSPDDLMERAKRVGVVLRDGGLFSSRTVYDNVGILLRNDSDLPLEVIDQLVRTQLDAFDLEEVAQELPFDLAAGQRKRVGFARALAMEPQIVVFDEPEAGLDAPRAALFFDLIRNIHTEKGGSYVVVTGALDLASRIADRIILMRRSRVIADGTPAELAGSANPYVRALLAAANQT